ncbi:MAG: diguanylate cyclase [Deltaproteobacteria bacterium]|nr:diguanylate cyclase [Deltaproteobacteria bacterium]
MPYKVLIIDDSENMRASLKKVVEGMKDVDEVLLADNGLQGYKVLRESSIDLVLCDLNMPGIDGFKFLNLKASNAEFSDIPVIMLTGQGDVSSKVRGLEVGASDYLIKPCDDAELIARVRVHLKLKELQDQLRMKNAELEELTRTDPLTGVANRRYFVETLSGEYHRSQRYQRPLSFIMLDIDHFKRVNDTYGHQAGDQTLIVVAKTLKRDLRMQDFIARYGGEEFALLLPETKSTDAAVAAERCRKNIEAALVVYKNFRFSITVSMGLASLPNDRVGDVEGLVKLADEALYTAKKTGRNRLVLA